jgi:hypothetical protein
MQVTWKPIPHGTETPRAQLPDSAFAFPAERKEPLIDAAHVHSAVARFGQVRGVTEAERAEAFANIKAAARYFGVAVAGSTWHDLVA